MVLEKKSHHQKGEKQQGGKEMLSENVKKVELKRVERNISGRSGLIFTQSCLEHIGLSEKIDELLPMKGKSNREIAASEKLLTEILSRIDGSSCLEDLEVLRKDEGFKKTLSKGSIVSVDTVSNFLKEDRLQEAVKELVKTTATDALKRGAFEELTYDNDATYYESGKESASYSYRGTKDYSVLMGFFAELDMCVTMEHRSGSVSPRDGILSQIKEAQLVAKSAGKEITNLRIDSAGHCDDIFRYANKQGMKYYISLSKNVAIKEIIANISDSEWKDYEEQEGREYAESVYVTESGVSMRIMILRWAKAQKQGELFKDKYSYHVVGTNDNEKSFNEALKFHSGRMGSENYNKELKTGYNCEWSPSNDIVVNANYFYVGVLAYNCMELIKKFFLNEKCRKYRIKKIRNWLIKQCGKLIESGRKHIFQIINATDRTYEMFHDIWCRLRYAW